MSEFSHRLFVNKDCKYFPCHKKVPEDTFNCLFCYCPLYNLENCGGRFKITESGVKSCIDCPVPHMPNGYDYVIKKLKESR